MVKSWKDGSRRAVAWMAVLAIAFGVAVVEAAPPGCDRIAASIRDRGCCNSVEKSCGSLWASYAKRSCSGDPCLIGCGERVCDAGEDQYCCNMTCSLCVPSDQTCPQEICVE